MHCTFVCVLQSSEVHFRTLLNKHVNNHTPKNLTSIYKHTCEFIHHLFIKLNIMLQRKDHPWWRAIPRNLFRSSPSRRHPNDGVLHTNNGNFSPELNSSPQEENAGSDFLSKEDMAAIAIQSCFRGHLVYIHTCFIHHSSLA